ncbi:translation initiation factor IF-2 isoform X1 [Leguminivora glycinivorella]|uniref:translation initiation factor IF-2 isoform X1 n=1 Tax=Leguminivora glycinivorella TaxID=1035111 RepID=UPI00200E99BF|nr:translation initiation factor IF-2 isoform X1 [Leguminivora glycinivorella]
MAQWVGFGVSVRCGSPLGCYQGTILAADGASITLTKPFRNGFPYPKAQVTLKASDIKSLEIISGKTSGGTAHSTVPVAGKKRVPRATVGESLQEQAPAPPPPPPVANKGKPARSKPIDIQAKNRSNTHAGSYGAGASGSTPKAGGRAAGGDKARRRNEACFGSAALEAVDDDFDFEGNLALFDKEVFVCYVGAVATDASRRGARGGGARGAGGGGGRGRGGGRRQAAPRPERAARRPARHRARRRAARAAGRPRLRHRLRHPPAQRVRRAARPPVGRAAPHGRRDAARGAGAVRARRRRRGLETRRRDAQTGPAQRAPAALRGRGGGQRAGRRRRRGRGARAARARRRHLRRAARRHVSASDERADRVPPERGPRARGHGASPRGGPAAARAARPGDLDAAPEHSPRAGVGVLVARRAGGGGAGRRGERGERAVGGRAGGGARRAGRAAAPRTPGPRAAPAAGQRGAARAAVRGGRRRLQVALRRRLRAAAASRRRRRLSRSTGRFVVRVGGSSSCVRLAYEIKCLSV